MRGAPLSPREATEAVAAKYDYFAGKYDDLGPSGLVALTAEALNLDRVKTVRVLRLAGRDV